MTVEAVPAVLHVCQSQRGAMLHAALQVIPHGMTKVIAKEEKRKKREKKKWIKQERRGEWDYNRLLLIFLFFFLFLFSFVSFLCIRMNCKN